MRRLVLLAALLAGGLLLTGNGLRGDRLAPAAARVVVQADKVGEPISKYVYGQFIEHLGRCIYGGIWAEMLEDRKFYAPVGTRASPWKPLAKTAAVVMDKEKPFVGAHTPRCDAPGGIVQGDLALQKGRKYVGYVWLAGDAGPVTVSLVWGDDADARQSVTIDALSATFAKTPFTFTAGGDTAKGRLEIRAAGKGQLRVGTASLMPADNVHGMRADTLALLKELDSPVYRWPGGNFVSGYNWKDGIGDRDRRPPRKNPAWKGVEHNDFGLDEFMVFCRLLKTEPYIAVNTGLGEADNAVQELEYANGATTTRGGALRAKNGHPEPYRVRWWGVGNEMYGNWQLGHMPLEKYVAKHNQFARALRAADPSIKLVAVGDVESRWTEGMLKGSADSMDLLSEHFYRQAKKDLAEHVRQIPDAVRIKVNAHRKYRQNLASLQGKDIRIALDEWNYWYGPTPFGELGTRYYQKDALGIAAGLHEMARNSDLIFMANYAQTVNVIGCIKTTKTAAAFETTGLVLKLYRQHFGTLPVAVSGESGLDVAAALTADRKTLTVAVVNPTLTARTIELDARGMRLSGTGRRWQIANADPMAYNDPGQPPKVTIEEASVKGTALPVAPCSVTLYALTAE
ncbi:MAG: alpha-L-arabinofuranosidase C-terminal domain-containing protein [Gemmataceae bacterium]